MADINTHVNDFDSELAPITPLVITIEPPVHHQHTHTHPNHEITEHAQEPSPEPIQKPAREAKKSGGGLIKVASDALFYAAVLLILITVLTSGSEGSPKSIFGFSYFTVVSRSMQDEIPMGSFILVKETDANKLKVGDDITFMRDGKIVTHKIDEIDEDYADGERGFVTKGVNNANPDSEIVKAKDVIGRVVFSLPVAGAAMASLGENIYLVIIGFGLCVITSFCLRWVSARKMHKRGSSCLIKN